jgi:xanthine dehydrogenase accessory factor
MIKHPQLHIWQFVQKSYQQQLNCVLLYVLESNGSSPGRQGFCMAVNEQQQMLGSIGGGMMEHKLVELAKGKLKESVSINSSELKKQIHNKEAGKHQSGMICSGEQTVFIYMLQPKDIAIVDAIIVCFEQHKNGLLEIKPSGISFSLVIPNQSFSFSMSDENNWVYQEKTGYKNILFVVGGGHCSLAFCKLMSSMDFYIKLFEERNELNTFLQNEFVHEKTIVSDYRELKTLIPSGNLNYVVIMTFGYRTDDIVLKALLGNRFAYLGVLGSKNKIAKMFDNYTNDGFDEAVLKSIHAPIGLNIQSKTPEEIAISIAAEIIQVKNNEVR